MLRLVSLTLFALLLSPVAAASGGLASVAVGPDGIVDDPSKDPYYLWATLAIPTVPNTGNQTHDCGPVERGHLHEAAQDQIAALRHWEPMTQPSASSWYPGCISGDLDAPCPGMPFACPSNPVTTGYVAYDVASGDYHIELTVTTEALGAVGLELVPPHGFTADVGLDGNSGIGTQADCEACPPPP